MHNIKDLRKNLETFKRKLTDRNIDFNAEDFSKKDTFNRELISKKESLEQEKKSLSKSKDKANFEKSKKISDEIEILSKKQSDSQSEVNKIIHALPNIALDDVPIGKDEKSNKLIKQEGSIKKFSFKIKSHVELGSKNNNIDFESSIKLSGSRFVVLKENYALLERALINFMLDTHVNEFKYTEISPPLIVNEDVESPQLEEDNNGNQLNLKDKAQAAIELSLSLYTQNKYREAINKLQEASILFPNHIGIKLNLTQALLVSKEKEEESIEDLDKAKRLLLELARLELGSKELERLKKMQKKYQRVAGI